MKPVIIIAIVIGISVVSVFAIGEIIWYFANQEFEKARDELKENLDDIFEKQYEPISEQKGSTYTSTTYCSSIVSSEANEIYKNQKIAVAKTMDDVQQARNQQISITHELGTTKSVYLHELFETKYNHEFYDTIENTSIKGNSSFSVTGVDANGVDAFWMENDSENVLLYFHGGAYFFGSPLQPQPFLISILSQNNLNVLTIDYRLVPENSYPDAIEDGKSAYHYLLEKGYLPDNIVISGDSAGGGLVLGTMLALKDYEEVLPAAIAVMSPWVDLTLSGDTYDTLKNVDKILSKENLSLPAQIYAGENSLQNPYISPINGEFDNFPPVLIQTGNREVFLSENTELSEKMKSDGVDVTFEVWECMWHVFQNKPIPETKTALSNIASFFDEHLSKN